MIGTLVLFTIRPTPPAENENGIENDNFVSDQSESSIPDQSENAEDAPTEPSKWKKAKQESVNALTHSWSMIKTRDILLQVWLPLLGSI